MQYFGIQFTEYNVEVYVGCIASVSVEMGSAQLSFVALIGRAHFLLLLRFSVMGHTDHVHLLYIYIYIFVCELLKIIKRYVKIIYKINNSNNKNENNALEITNVFGQFTAFSNGTYGLPYYDQLVPFIIQCNKVSIL